MTTQKVLGLTFLLWFFGVVMFPIGCTVHTSSNLVQVLSKAVKIGDVPKKDNGWFKIQFISEQEGWLGCGKKLWRTTDGGRSWEATYSGNNSWDVLDYIKKLEFTSSQTGWMLVPPSKLLKTEDGGYTWVQQKNVPLSFPKAQLNDVEFTKDGKTGWIVGGLYQSRSLKNEADPFTSRFPATAIFRTNDGGVSWVQETVFSPHGGRTGQIFLLNHQALAIDEAGFFYRETNAGQWKRADYTKGNCDKRMLLHTTQTGQEGGDIFEPVAMFFLNTNQGWLGFKNGYIAKTMDGGRTWCDVFDPNTVWPNPSYDAFFSKIHFANSTHGWGFASEGRIYETNDGGSSWQKLDIDARIEDIYFLSPDLGLAVAEQGLFRIGS